MVATNATRPGADAGDACHDVSGNVVGVVNVALGKQPDSPYPGGECQQRCNGDENVALYGAEGLRGCVVTRSVGVGWDKGEAGGRSGGGGHASGDEGYAADDVSGYEMSGGRGFAEVFPAVDEREQGGQIAKNGQGVFGDRVIRVDYLPDNGCRRREQGDAYHSQ